MVSSGSVGSQWRKCTSVSPAFHPFYDDQRVNQRLGEMNFVSEAPGRVAVDCRRCVWGTWHIFLCV